MLKNRDVDYSTSTAQVAAHDQEHESTDDNYNFSRLLLQAAYLYPQRPLLVSYPRLCPLAQQSSCDKQCHYFITDLYKAQIDPPSFSSSFSQTYRSKRCHVQCLTAAPGAVLWELEQVHVAAYCSCYLGERQS